MNNIIIHKIIIYLKEPIIAKLFFNFHDYRLLINTSNSHYNQLYEIYGSVEISKIVSNIRSVKAIFQLKYPIYIKNNLMKYAAKNGHLEVVKWLHENHIEGRTDEAMDWAAKNGHLEIVIWLHLNRKERLTSGGMCTTDAMDWAAHNGYLEVVKWLHENRQEGCTMNAMNFAASNGHLEIVKYLHQNQKMCTYLAMDWAAYNGHLEVVKWLHENRTEGCTTYAMDIAAKEGHLEVIKWLHENRQEGCTSNAMYLAAQFDHLEVVKWLYANHYIKMSLSTAAEVIEWITRFGNPEIAKWLKDNIKYRKPPKWDPQRAIIKKAKK